MKKSVLTRAGLGIALSFSLAGCSVISSSDSSKSSSQQSGSSKLAIKYSSTDYSQSNPIIKTPDASEVQMGPSTKTPVSLPFSKALPIPDGPIGDANKTYTIGLSLPFTTNIWFLGLEDSLMLEAQRHKNVKVVVLNANQDATQQANDVQSLLAQKVDAIIVDPLQEAALVPAMEKAMNAGIPVIDVDRQLTKPAYSNVVTGDFNQGPTDIGNWVVQQLKAKYGEPKGVVAEIQTDIGSTPQIARYNSFKKITDKYTGIKVVGLQSAGADETKAYNVMRDIMSGNPNIDVVYAQSEAMAMGAWKAMHAAGKDKGVLFVACDLSKEGVQWIKDGQLQALAPWTPFMGDVALRAAIYDLEGKVVPKTVWLPSQPVVTKDNVDQFGGTAFGPAPQALESYWKVGSVPGK